MPPTSLLISNREMQAARDNGRARPLTPDIPEFQRCWGEWWLACEGGWLRITDTHLAGRLSAVRERLDFEHEEQACLRAQAQAAQGREGPSWLPHGATAPT